MITSRSNNLPEGHGATCPYCFSFYHSRASRDDCLGKVIYETLHYIEKVLTG